MRQPLATVALLFGAGIVAGLWVPAPLGLLFGLTLGAGVAALLWSQGRTALLWVLLALAGWTNEATRTAILAPDDLRRLFTHGPELVSVRGIIAAPPSAKIFERGTEAQWHSSAMIDVEAVKRQDGWEPAFGRITASVQGTLGADFFAGQQATVNGVLREPPGPLAPGLFDARQFYANEGVYFQLRTESTNDWIASSDAGRTAPLAQRFTAWAKKTLALGLPEEDDAQDFIWALALDWKGPLTAAMQEPFLRAGTYHIFAVDGLRIGILAGMAAGLLRALRVPRPWRGLVVIPLVWGYVALTGWPPSAARAAIMTTVVVAGWALRRPVDLINSLFAAAFIILCWDPRQMFQPGFQMSFVIVFSIGLLLPPARDWVFKAVFHVDPFLPKDAGREMPAWRRTALRYVMNMLLVSAVAWLASIPLCAYYFHLFTPWSLPANFLVVPLTALALMSCAGSLFFGAWLPGVSVLFNNSAWALMKAALVVSQWWAGFRPRAVNSAEPSAVTLVCYYAALAALVSLLLVKTKRKRTIWAGVALLAGLAFAGNEFWMARTACVTALPARGGSVVFVDSECQLFDCGNGAYAEGVLKPFLQAQGVNRLAGLTLTSQHVDQVGGAAGIETNFAVLLTNAVGQLRAGAQTQGWAVLHPAPGERHPRADDDALAARKMVNGWKVLLLSRLGRAGQDALLARGGDVRSDLVIAGLPAQDEPLSEPLLDAIQPKVIIIIDSDLPATRRATAALRERLGRRSARVLYCRDTGALTVELRTGAMTIRDAGGSILASTID